MEIVIDSSVLVGLLVPDDIWHRRAVELWEAIKADRHRGVFVDCVAAESISVAVRRLREKGLVAEMQALLDRLDVYMPYDTMTWILPDTPRVYSQALSLIRSSSGELNFSDALIALACRERDIPAIASFDADFDRIAWLKRVSVPADVGTTA